MTRPCTALAVALPLLALVALFLHHDQAMRHLRCVEAENQALENRNDALMIALAELRHKTRMPAP